MTTRGNVGSAHKTRTVKHDRGVSQNNLTVDKTSVKDALNEVVAVDDREAIRHENEDATERISIPTQRGTIEREKTRVSRNPPGI